MFLAHLRRKCVLPYLVGTSWRCQLGLPGLLWHLRSVFPYFLFWLSVCWCKWSVKVLLLLFYSQFPVLCLFISVSVCFGKGDGTPLQYSCLANPMDGGAWWAAVHGVSKSRTRLSDFTFTFHFHALEKEMATHSSVLAWRIPGTGETGGPPSLGSHRVRHGWSDSAAAAVYA